MNAIVVLIDTLRRDHIGSYGTDEVSKWFKKPVETPNLDQFAASGVLYEQAHLGSFPCIPLRRDLWTGRYEFPWRGWGPLEDEDLDLIWHMRSNGMKTMYVGDHYHLLERDAGNYLNGFEGWDMIRGQEHDPYITDSDIPVDPISHLNNAFWRSHQGSRRGKIIREEELFAPRVFRNAAKWLEGNATKQARKERPFFLMVECFDPHEPWDPPMDMVDAFDPGYKGEIPHCPNYGFAEMFTEDQLRQIRAMYAAELTLVDRWFGYFLNTFHRLGLAEDTMVIVTTDHGFFLGEHGFFGKPNRVPLYNQMSHIPFFMYHPDCQPGTRSQELVQLVDVLPTVLDALRIPLPQYVPDKLVPGQSHKKAWEGLAKQAVQLHGRSLLSEQSDKLSVERKAVFTGKFSDVIRICDGEWCLYLHPLKEEPIYWYGTRAPGRTFDGLRGTADRIHSRYPMYYSNDQCGNELYHIKYDYMEQNNLIASNIHQTTVMEHLFLQWLASIQAPSEIAIRYGLKLGQDEVGCT